MSRAAILKARRGYWHNPKACAASTCCEVVIADRIFCPNHWFFLPQWMRTAIIQTFLDGEWGEHQEAVRQASDLVDAAVVEARSAGFSSIRTHRDGAGEIVRYQERFVV